MTSTPLTAQPTLETPTARVFTMYKSSMCPHEDTLPPHPGSSWTRFVCISDTHSMTTKFTGDIPPGDFLLHAGDLSSWGEPRQLWRTVEWIKGLEGFQYKVLIAGNHDLCLDPKSPLYDTENPEDAIKSVENAREMVRGEDARAKGIIYLEYERVALRAQSGKEWVFYGSPAAPRYAAGSFQYNDSVGAQAISALIPADVEILLTHTPAYGILDLTRKGKHAGCKSLSERLGKLRKLRLHVFGHIHEAKGAQLVPLKSRGIYSLPGLDPPPRLERVSVNAAMTTVASPAVVVDLRNW